MGGGGGGPRVVAPPPIPKEKRDSIIAAGGKVPPPPPPPARTRGGPRFGERSSDWAHKGDWGAAGGLFVFKNNHDSYALQPTVDRPCLLTAHPAVPARPS